MYCISLRLMIQKHGIFKWMGSFLRVEKCLGKVRVVVIVHVFCISRDIENIIEHLEHNYNKNKHHHWLWVTDLSGFKKSCKHEMASRFEDRFKKKWEKYFFFLFFCWNICRKCTYEWILINVILKCWRVIAYLIYDFLLLSLQKFWILKILIFLNKKFPITKKLPKLNNFSLLNSRREDNLNDTKRSHLLISFYILRFFGNVFFVIIDIFINQVNQ